MIEPEPKELPLIADALSSLPDPVQASFFKVIKQLLGNLTAIPSAKLRQYAQAIDDTTTARSTSAAILAKAAAEEAINNPVLMAAASEVFLPTALRKVKNRLNVAQSSAEHLSEAFSAGANGDGAAPPNDDWMNSFMRFAEDASSERLQDLFGRILSGQILRPGAFSVATLRTLSELDQEIANDFSQAWSHSVGEEVDYSPLWQRGDGFSRWKRLDEAGLMAPTASAQYLPDFKPVIADNCLWIPAITDDAWLTVHFQQNATVRWDNIRFTRVGREIGSLLPKPDYASNMRQIAKRLQRSGVSLIELHTSSSETIEILWRA